MRKIYIFIAFFSFAFNTVSAQDIGLNIGDQIPDFKIPKIINSTKREGRSSDFNDRLLIVDFWGTGCGACILALPHLNEMQKKFGQKIQILPVSNEKEANIVTFWKRNKNTKNLTIPSVVEDKIFQKYFKHRDIPHEVWIYKGKVIGITAADYVNEVNIEKVLSGAVVDWPVKNDFYAFDKSKSLFNPDPQQINIKTTFLKYAAISDYKDGVNSTGLSGGIGIVRDSSKKTVRAYFLNQGIYNSYLSNWLNAYGQQGLKTLAIPNSEINGPNTIIWEVKDKNRYNYNSKLFEEQAWVRKNAICFESLNPDTGQTNQQVYGTINRDLNRLLGLNVNWRKWKEKVLVLVRTTNEDKLKTKNPTPGILPDENINTYDDRKTEWQINKNGSLIKLRDITGIGYFIGQELMKANNCYVFDETKYDGAVDLDLNISSWTDIPAIRKALQPYGLDLKEEERLVDKFVFTEVNGGLLIDGQMQSEANAKKSAQAGMKDPSMEENSSFMELNEKKTGVVVLPSGLQYKILKQGNGVKPVSNDKVNIQYTGTMVNGKIFDSSYATGRVAEIRIDKDKIIAGWAEALPLMPVGSKWILYIPAALAYGEHTGRGQFPPNSILIFEIELLGIAK